MKTNIAALLLCLSILVTISLTASAQDSSNAASPSNVTTVTESDETAMIGTTVTEPVVTAENLSKCTITLSNTSYKFSGVEKKPKVTVSNGKKVFSKSDYTVTYKDNINAGTGKVIITANQNSKVLKGSVTKYFRIDKKELSTMRYKTLSADSFVYTGKAFKPSLSLSGDVLKKLTLNKDYTVTYKNNKAIGIATVTATGKGNYKGTYSKTFEILPQKVTGIKASDIKSTTFKLSWNKVSGNIDGYKIYRYNAAKKTYDYAVSTTNTYFNVSGREAATSYTYLVRAYKKSGDKYLMGESSSAKKVVMKPTKVVSAPSAYKGNNFVFKWEKTKADGYQIRYSKNKSLKNAKVKTVNSGNKTSLSVKLSSNVNYYYKIRAYKKVSGKTYYGDWSDKKTTRFSNVYSSYSTTFNSPAGRTANIKRACEYIDGTILRPGEVFSFNKIVGRRTPERGFKIATVYSGQSVVSGYGGGVCQVSTTIFNAVLYANLDIVQRHQHSMTVHYVPYGRDAAISWGTQDFQFRNSTNQDIKISAKVYNNSKIEIKLLTNSASKPKKVSLNVSKVTNGYKLTRSVGGKVNYTTYSYY